MNNTNIVYALEYLKSALSVNTHVGCNLGCGYCVVDEFVFGKAERIYSPEESIELLLSNRLFITEKTPITLNNRTDPLLPQVRADTFRMLDLLRKRNISNPKMIVSKLALEQYELEQLEDSPGNNYFFVSYSNLPSNIEKVPHSSQRRSLEVLSKRKNVHAVHYWRPLIKGLNDDMEKLKEVIEDVYQVCEGSVLSGLRIYKNLAEKISRLGADISGWNGDTQHKYLPQEIVDKILELKMEKYPDYPIYRHTSCAICAPLGKRDYNFHFLRSSKCLPGCSNEDNCYIPEKVPKEFIDSVMSRLGLRNIWYYKENKLIIKGSISEEERSCISHWLEYPVVSEELTRAPSEEVLRK